MPTPHAHRRPRGPTVTVPSNVNLRVQPSVHVRSGKPRVFRSGGAGSRRIPIHLDIGVTGHGSGSGSGTGEGKKDKEFKKSPGFGLERVERAGIAPFDIRQNEPEFAREEALRGMEAMHHEMRGWLGRLIDEEEMQAMEKVSLPSELEPWQYASPKFPGFLTEVLAKDAHHEVGRFQKGLENYKEWMKRLEDEANTQSTPRTILSPVNPGIGRLLLAPFSAAWNIVRAISNPLGTWRSTVTYKRRLLARAKAGLAWEEDKVKRIEHVTHAFSHDVEHLYAHTRPHLDDRNVRMGFWNALSEMQKKYIEVRDQLGAKQNPYLRDWFKQSQMGAEFGPHKSRAGIFGHVEHKGGKEHGLETRELFETPGDE